MYALLQINEAAFFIRKNKLFRGEKKLISEFYITKSYSFQPLFPSRFFVFLYFSAKSVKKLYFFDKTEKTRYFVVKILKNRAISP